MTKKFLFLRTALALFMVLCSTMGWGQTTGTITITRASFPSGALTYGTDDVWTVTASTGETIAGSFDLFSNIGQTTMQTRTSSPIGSYPHNTIALPGNITSIVLTGGGTGTARAWTPYLSTSALTKSNYTDGVNQGTQTASSNSASTTWNISAASGYKYFYLNMTGGAAYLNSIVITYEITPACQTSDLAFTNTTVSQDLSTGTYTQTATSSNGTTDIIYTSSDETVATVNAATGEVAMLTVGTTTITATQAEGTHNATLYCAGTATYDLTITSSSPSLAILGNTDNGAACINTQAVVQNYTITNSGNSSAGGLTVVSDNSQFVVSNLSATTVSGSNGTVTFDVTFTPTSAGVQNATITVQSSTSGSNVATFDITGTGNTTADPALATSAATSISATEATLNGDITSLGTCLSNPLTEKGFVYGTSVNPEFNGGTFLTDGTAATGVFDATVTTLSPATTYYWKAYVMDGTGQYYFSNELSFTTTLDAPVATAATNISHNGFTANWNAVTGADSYVLEVYEETGTPMTDLIISEYVEGSSNNKAIELYNGTGGTIDLSNYSLRKQSNGAGAYVGDYPLSGMLSSGDTYVIVHTSANNTLKTYADALYGSAPMDFNGNDAVALFKNGIQLDEVGVFNQTSNWGNDTTLRRKSSIGSPTDTYSPTEWDSFPTDTFADLGSHTANTVTQTLVSTQNVGNVTSFDVTNLTPDTDYYYVVRTVDNTFESSNSNSIAVKTLSLMTTWNGTTWDNGAPAAGSAAVIDGVYSTDATHPSITAETITITQNGVLQINSGDSVTATTVTVNDGGNFIEQDGAAANITNFTLNKTATSAADRYVFWSSPVAGQNVYDIYPALTPQFVMTYNSDTDLYPVVADPTTAGLGVGYSVKVPAGATEAVFSGTPNTGIIPVALDAVANANGNTWNLIGNPYPSNLNLVQLYNDGNNGIDPSIYLWNNLSTGNTQQASSVTDWTIFNASGTGTWQQVTNGLVGTGKSVKPGQGFLVKATAPLVTFTNNMRNADDATFLNKAQSSAEGKFWLQLTTPAGQELQTAVTYGEGALNTYEAFDSKMLNVGANGLYTFADNHKLGIQGRDYFVNTDVVTVGNKHAAAGQYTISLAGTTGLFAAGQAIYLKDKQTGTYTNLQTDDYVFTADALEQQNRFEVVYMPQGALGTVEVAKGETVVYKDGEHFTVKSEDKILSIEVFDASGRLIGTEKPNRTTATVIVDAKGMYVLKIKTTHTEVTKKIMK